MCNHKIVTLNYHIITVLCNETIVTMGYCVFTTYGHLILFYQTVVKLKWIVIAMMPWSTEHIDTGYLWNICRLLPCTDIVHSGYRDVLWFNTYSLKINSWGLHLFKKKSSLANIFIQRTLANALELSYSKMLDR